MNTETILSHAKTLSIIEQKAFRAALIDAADQLSIPQRVTEKKLRQAKRGPYLRYPQIGGGGLVVAPNAVVDTPAFLDRWAPSGIVVWVYALGCEGTLALARLLNLPIFKVGSTEGDIRQRMRELGRDQYGSMWRAAGALTFERGFRTWISEHLPVSVMFSPNSPVLPGVRAIAVRLPIGMTPKQFDDLLSAEVQKAALANLARTNAGRAYCKARDVDPNQTMRFTSYEFGAGARLSTATEFAIFRPRAEADRLAVIAERIVVDFVMKGSD